MLHKKHTIRKASILFLLFILVGCQDDIRIQNKEEQKIELEQVTNVMYFPWDYKLVYVDGSKNKIKFFKSEENKFQYTFNTPCKYYTSGDSMENNFEILEVKENQINI